MKTLPTYYKGTGCSDPWAYGRAAGQDGAHWKGEHSGFTISESAQTATLGADTVWLDVLPALDALDLSFRSIQSAPRFTVAGSIAANIHGRDTRHPLLKDQIVAMRLAMPDGRELIATPREHKTEFHSAIGTMGRGPRIITATVKLTTKRLLQQSTERVSTTGLVDRVQNSGAHMAHFMPHPSGAEGMLKLYSALTKVDAPTGPEFAREFPDTALQYLPERYAPKSPLKRDFGIRVMQAISRISRRSDALRWELARKWFYEVPANIPPQFRNNSFSTFSRPALKNFRIAEYFVAPEKYAQFVAFMHNIYREAGAPILFAGTRLVFEETPSPEGSTLWSAGITEQSPWLSLVLNYCAPQRQEDAIIRNQITPALHFFSARSHAPYGWGGLNGGAVPLAAPNEP